MPTIRVSADAPDPAVLERAAALLRSGRLVAFPTETVYGLGAHALDGAAVRRIYEAKGRPPLNPVIVHVSSIAMARELAGDWPELAERLARRFWPGPLTLVVRKTARIPDEVTGGGATVGLRMPSHPVALAIIERAGIPVAAPSANRSNQVSPTTAAHVERSLGDRVDLIIDAGPTSVGIESTVVDVTGAEPRVLRPGMITADDIMHAGAGTAPTDGSQDAAGAVPRSPGMMGKHYAPEGRVVLFGAEEEDRAAATARAAVESGQRVGAMVFSSLGVPGVTEEVMAGGARDYARQLYATLHTLDVAGCALILVAEPPATEEWRGVRDRLHRAAREG
jgi:L-threonylcarbamoyladenylate synthase